MHDQTTKPAQPRSITRWRAGMIRDLIGWAYRTPRWVVSLPALGGVAALRPAALWHIPEVGETVQADGWWLQVLAVERRAITRLRLTPARAATPEAGPAPLE